MSPSLLFTPNHPLPFPPKFISKQSLTVVPPCRCLTQYDEPNEIDDGSVEKVDKWGSVVINHAAVVSLSTANKKLKKKKKNKKKNKDRQFSNGDGLAGSVEVDLEVSSLKVEARSSKKNSKTGVQSHHNIAKQPKSSILNVDSKFLNAENELRRVFGSKVVSQFESVNKAGPSKQGRSGKRGGYTHRKSLLVSPSEHWPRWDGSLSMGSC